MKTLRETFATLRQPLGVLLVLVGGGAGLAALAVVLLPALPTSVQQDATNALGWVPGLYRGLEMSRAEPQLTGSLRLEVGEQIVARFPATDEGWSTGGFELNGPALPAVLAAWAALAALLLHLLWYVTPSRQVIGLALLLGISSGLVVAHSLPMVPRYWASFWLRGMGGLPGLQEIQGSPVGIDNRPSSVTLISLGGRLAEYPPEAPPWDSESRVVIHDRCRAWFAGYGVLAWLGSLLVAAAVRARRWRVRVPVAALGLGMLCWIVLPFLPGSVGLAPLGAVTGLEDPSGSSVYMTRALVVLRATRLGFGVGLGLLLLLVAAWLLVLTPFGLAAAAVTAWRSRADDQAAEVRQEEEDAPLEPIAVLGREDLAERVEPTDRPNADPESVEPHPSPHEEP